MKKPSLVDYIIELEKPSKEFPKGIAAIDFSKYAFALEKYCIQIEIELKKKDSKFCQMCLKNPEGCKKTKKRFCKDYVSDNGTYFKDGKIFNGRRGY